MPHFTELLSAIKEWEAACNGVKPFQSSSLVDFLTKKGYDVLNTKGLPFNGTTYEIRKPLKDIPNAFQVCGHYKYVSQIYGNGLTIYVYPPSCKGGSHLNGDELELHEYTIETYR